MAVLTVMIIDKLTALALWHLNTMTTVMAAVDVLLEVIYLVNFIFIFSLYHNEEEHNVLHPGFEMTLCCLR